MNTTYRNGTSTRKTLAEWASIISPIITVTAILFGGGFIYNRVWNRARLTYTLLPSYDIGDQAFSGVIIQNQGKTTLTHIMVIIADLGAIIETINMPGVHEPAVIVDGGEGNDGVIITMDRFSPESSLPIYMLTDGILSQAKFFVSSAEVKGVASNNQSNLEQWFTIIAILLFLTNIFWFLQYWKKLTIKRTKESKLRTLNTKYERGEISQRELIKQSFDIMEKYDNE